MKTFKVLQYKQNKVKYYDILPYFRNCWKNNLDKEEKAEIKEKNKSDTKRKVFLKQWIKSKAQYMFCARCRYEFLMADWPFFVSYQMKEELKKLLINGFNIDDYTQLLDFENIIIADMHKIDIYEQIMMNIDVITDILFEEFKLSNKQ